MKKRGYVCREVIFFGHDIGWFFKIILHPIELIILLDRYGTNRKSPEEAKTLTGSWECCSRESGNGAFGAVSLEVVKNRCQIRHQCE